MALTVGDYGAIGALFMGAVAFVVLGMLFSYLFCRESPAPGAAKDSAPAAKPAAKPAPAKPAPAAAAAPAPVASSGKANKPTGISEARGGKPDDLKQIKGVGPKLEQLLNSMGFYHFDQIAGWGADEVAWVDDNLKGFKGRVTRDNWVEQAKSLAAGGATELSKRVDDGNVYLQCEGR